jgi:hypothetical protein
MADRSSEDRVHGPMKRRARGDDDEKKPRVIFSIEVVTTYNVRREGEVIYTSNSYEDVMRFAREHLEE